MRRGPGKLQRAILKLFEDSPGEWGTTGYIALHGRRSFLCHGGGV